VNKIKTFFKENYKIILIFIAIYIIINIKLPYYILAPGGTIDISEKIEVEKSNDLNGKLYLLYATEIKATIPTLIMSKINPKWDLYKNEEKQVSDESIEEVEFRNKILLNNSIDIATKIAYEKANKQITTKASKNYILGITNESSCDFEIGDIILEVENEKVSSTQEIKNIIENSKEANINLKVKRDDEQIITSCEINQDKKIGVVIVTDYEYELDPNIKINFSKSESGSSGGMMLTLNIYTNIIDEDIIKGRKIAGTGTIDEYGNVGEIGGVKYKIIGASKDDIDIIFVPEKNYKEAIEVKEKYDYDMKIISIKTFDEVINYLKEN